jgi:hypothetical protein
LKPVTWKYVRRGRKKLMKRKLGSTGIMQVSFIIYASRLKAHIPIEKGAMKSD